MPSKPPEGTKGIGWGRRARDRILADISQTGEVHIPDTLIPKAKLTDIQDTAKSNDYITGVRDAWRIAKQHASECRAEADNPSARAASAIAADIFRLSERSPS